MLTPKDIKNLTEFQKNVFATKDDLKVELNGLESKINKVQTSLDAVLKEKVTNTQVRTVANRRIKELENWADKASVKINIEFKH